MAQNKISFFLQRLKDTKFNYVFFNDLEKTVKEEGILVTKEYVKGRKNVYSHPAVADFNKTTDSANKTVATLMKIITTLRDRKNEDVEDPLLNILSRGS